MPKVMGGKGEGTNPEQLFAMGYACAYFVNMSKNA
jgi:organic hydroperoxide reductase OsmC/OhrA